MNKPTYKLTITKNQLRVIMIALESYFRTRMGQFFDLASDVATNGFVYTKDNPDNDRLFNEYINRRNDSQDMFEKAFNVAAPDPYKRNKTPDMVTAIDIWHVIRHQMYLEFPEPKDHYTVDAYPPTPWGNEPLPKIVKEEKQWTKSTSGNPK